MAIVLFATVPSGDHEVVRVRSELISRLHLPAFKASRALRPAVIHDDRPVGQDASRLAYVGCGRNDPQHRPSQCFNPFLFFHQSEAVANDLFGSWLSIRADLEFFLQPLVGMALLCDCQRGPGCHVHTLLRIFDRVFPPPGDCAPHYGFVDTATLLEPMKQPSCLVEDVCRENLSESDDSGTEVQIVTPATRPDDVSQIDETRRGSFNSDNFSRERLAWPSSWVALVSSIRMLNCMVFWEIFSGAAGLTIAFEANGWSVAPPIDILHCPDYDLLNPLFNGFRQCRRPRKNRELCNKQRSKEDMASAESTCDGFHVAVHDLARVGAHGAMHEAVHGVVHESSWGCMDL